MKMWPSRLPASRDTDRWWLERPTQPLSWLPSTNPCTTWEIGVFQVETREFDEQTMTLPSPSCDWMYLFTKHLSEVGCTICDQKIHPSTYRIWALPHCPNPLTTRLPIAHHSHLPWLNVVCKYIRLKWKMAVMMVMLMMTVMLVSL